MDSNRRFRLGRAARARLEAWGLPFVAAVFAGAHLEGLLLFLNPRLPLALGAVLRGTAIYTLLLAPGSLAALLGVARWRGVAVRRLLPWSLTLIAAFGALGDWVHASYYNYYLPSGIADQLIKTALWLTLGSLLFFYTALLHTLHGRRYGLRSQLLLFLVALGTVYALFDRRTSFHPSAPQLPRFVGLSSEGAPQAVVVVLPTATLDALLPLAEQGRLPFFADAFTRGARGRLGIFGPPRSIALEATLATGKLPFKHGLVGAEAVVVPWQDRATPLRLLPIGVGFRHWGVPGARALPAIENELEALPLWTILLRLDRGALAVGFPPPLGAAPERPEPALPRSTAERELELVGAEPLAAALGSDRARLAAARERLTARDQALFVRLGGLELASLESYGGFQAALFEGERASAARRAANVLTAYYAGLDDALAELWSGLSAPRLLAVTSAYGVSAPVGAERIALELANQPRYGGRVRASSDGFLLLLGEGIRPGVQLQGGSIADVAPTLLYSLALPVPRDADGKVLAGAFEPALLQRRPLSFVPSYDGLPGPTASAP